MMVDIDIPEAQDLPATPFQISGPALVMAKFSFAAMGVAIGFDDEFQADAGEVGDIGADRVLAAKMRAVHLPCPQVEPQAQLGARHLAAKSPRQGLCLRPCIFHHDAPWTNHWGLRVSGP